jgi:hypothetical protein
MTYLFYKDLIQKKLWKNLNMNLLILRQL